MFLVILFIYLIFFCKSKFLWNMWPKSSNKYIFSSFSFLFDVEGGPLGSHWTSWETATVSSKQSAGGRRIDGENNAACQLVNCFCAVAFRQKSAISFHPPKVFFC